MKSGVRKKEKTRRRGQREKNTEITVKRKAAARRLLVRGTRK
jgi:hypothetical protein